MDKINKQYRKDLKKRVNAIMEILEDDKIFYVITIQGVPVNVSTGFPVCTKVENASLYPSRQGAANIAGKVRNGANIQGKVELFSTVANKHINTILGIISKLKSDVPHINAVLKEASETAFPVLLESDGIPDTVCCLINNLTESGFVAHYSTNSFIYCPLSSITNARLALLTDETSHLERVASKIY